MLKQRPSQVLTGWKEEFLIKINLQQNVALTVTILLSGISKDGQMIALKF